MFRRLTRNLGWKFLSLAIAVFMWFVLVGEPEVATSVWAPVQFRNIPPDLELSSDVPDRVHLEVRGPSGRLGAAALANTAVVLDLGTVLKPGERTFTIQPRNLNLPVGVVLSRAVPAQVRLRFENRVSREVPVLVRYAGPPPAGYRIAGQHVQPATLRIIGPESRVNLVEGVQTDPIDPPAVVGRAIFEVPVYTSDAQVRFAVSPPRVRVTVNLEKAP